MDGSLYYLYHGESIIGPYSIEDISRYVDAGLIDKAAIGFRADNASVEKPIEFFIQDSTRRTANEPSPNEAYYVFKEDGLLGPFLINDICSFVHSGLVLKRDLAFRADIPNVEKRVEEILSEKGMSTKVEHRGNLFEQIKSIGTELILPHSVFTKEPWKKDSRLFILALVGLTLSILMPFLSIVPSFAIFYIVALYFSVIWGLFFHYLFKTSQVSIKLSVGLFFLCQLIVFIVWDILGLPQLNPLYSLLDSEPRVISAISYIFGVGLTEEFFKLLPILCILHFSKRVLRPQTMVYYGLISGIAFGVFEGVHYQMGANFKIFSDTTLAEGYVITFVLNIARLTCIPFLHAIWCGIASYFSSFAYLYPRYRIALYTLALLIPATLHGLYDYTAGISSLLTIPIVIVSVVLLMVYLNINYSFHSRLAD